jgi:hypothetical protein
MNELTIFMFPQGNQHLTGKCLCPHRHLIHLTLRNTSLSLSYQHFISLAHLGLRWSTLFYKQDTDRRSKQHAVSFPRCLLSRNAFVFSHCDHIMPLHLHAHLHLANACRLYFGCTSLELEFACVSVCV